MRRYASPRRMFPSIDHGPSQTDSPVAAQRRVLSGYIRTRRIRPRHTAFSTCSKYAAPNAIVRELSTRLKSAANLRVRTSHSTAEPQPDRSRDATPDTLAWERNAPENQAKTGEPVTASAEDDHADPAGKPVHDEPGNLLERQRIAPWKIPHVKPKLCYRHMEWRGEGFHCVKRFFFYGMRETIESHGEAATESKADIMASLDFSSRLGELIIQEESTDANDQHEQPPRTIDAYGQHRRPPQQITDKRQLGQSPPPINLSLRLDDDLLFVMRRTLPQLSNATRRLSTANRGARWLRDGQRSIAIRTDTERQRSKDMGRRSSGNLPFNPQLVNLPDQLKTLQVNRRKEEILDLVRANTYTIVVAATGTGKSTQLPQIFLNDTLTNNSGTDCRIVCVQPRRVPTASLADRVAHERMEKVGDSVGYHVRFGARLANAPSNITYCTTGIILQLLQHVPGYLDSVSHIILDEVHERDTDIDMLMLLLRSYVNERLAKGAHVPKIILTSATIDVDLFASYFQNKLPDGTLSPAPHIEIPGNTFEVTKYFLSDLLDSLSRAYKPSTVKMLLKEESTKTYLKKFQSPCKEPPEPEAVTQAQPPEDAPVHSVEPVSEGSSASGNEEPATEAQSQEECALPESAQPVYHDNDPLVPIGLTCAAIFNALSTSTDGSILVFLPGLRDMMNVEDALHGFGAKLGFDFSARTKFKILKLHSNLPENHAAPFEYAESSCRRIILATTIAETSITIPDVRFVVDTGKSRQNNYYPETRSRELAYGWVSRSCVAQRAGRAGRTQSGKYFALFPREKYESLRVTRAPEMARDDLESLCLRIKDALPETHIEDALRLAIEPPGDFRVRSAVATLKHLGALRQDEGLSTLGRHLLKLAVRPALGKLVFLGILFRCLDPLLIIGALGDDLNLFRVQHESEDRAQAWRLRRGYAEASKSDHITAINAFQTLREVYCRDGRQEAREFADFQHIHYPRFHAALMGGKQLMQQLCRNRFIQLSKFRDDGFQFGGAALNVNSKSIALIKALLLHVNSLNIAAPIPEAKDRAYRTEGAREGFIASSVNAGNPPRGLLVYDSKRPVSKTNFSFINTTLVTPLVACLFGGPLEVLGNHVCLDMWLKMRIENISTREDDYAIKVLVEMRKALDRALNTAVESLQPSSDKWTPSMASHADLVETLSTKFLQVLDLVPGDKYQRPLQQIKPHDGCAI